MRARQLHRGFPRLGAGVRKEHAIHARALRQPQRQLRLPLVKEQIRSMNQRTALARNRLFNRGMPVAQRIHADAAQQVEIPIAVLIDQIHALAALKEQRIAFIG